MWYYLAKKLLFSVDAELSHDFTFFVLKLAQRAGIVNKLPPPSSSPTSLKVFGLTFPNPVGLAAGLDKNGECIPLWQALGFGFVEVGTVTPKPQKGNPKPRLFRLPEYSALINKMGFNNKGVDYLIEKAATYKRYCPLGINIGKNRDTALADAYQDYIFCFEKVYPVADYVTVNISSPNTPGLRNLQQSKELESILLPLKERQKKLTEGYNKYVPIIVKISPDLANDTLSYLIEDLLRLHIDGVIATNTTVSRKGLTDAAAKIEGGLSGAPLFADSTAIVRHIYQQAGEQLPIIAVGGIMHPDQAKTKLQAGAKLIQLYTGLIYQGPSLIKKTVSVCS